MKKYSFLKQQSTKNNGYTGVGKNATHTDVQRNPKTNKNTNKN
jgi:hypothetical protein